MLILFRWFELLAVRYNGKYLYEELVEKREFDPHQNESTVESEESFLLKNHSRFESSMKVIFDCFDLNFLKKFIHLKHISHSQESNTSNQYGVHVRSNESKAENEEDVSQRNSNIYLAFLNKYSCSVFIHHQVATLYQCHAIYWSQ